MKYIEFIKKINLLIYIIFIIIIYNIHRSRNFNHLTQCNHPFLLYYLSF